MLTIDKNSVSHLRRSQRKLTSQVPFSPISSFDRFNTPPLKFISSIDNFSLNQTPVSNPSNLSNKSLGSVTRSFFSVELANGSVESSTTSNGVEGFQGLGGSVRASKVGNSSGLIGKENGGIDVDLVKTIKGYSRKRSQSCGLKTMGKIDEKDEMGVESSKDSMTVSTSLKKQRRKKRRNVTSGSEDKSKSQHQKAVCGGGGGGSGLRSPLSSIENISSSKTYSRRPKKRMTEVCFTEGQEVEVANMDEGFYGSWYSATIIGPSTEKGTYILEYHTLADETEPKPLRESVRASQIRPRPPTLDVRSFELNEVVDAYDNDGWWQGVVVKVLQDDMYIVRFTKFKMEMEFGKSDLRTCMEWIQGTWVRPQSEEILSGVKKSRKTTCKLSKSIDGVEGTKMPNSIDDKSRTNMFYGVDKENTQFRSNVSTDLIETPSVEATQSGNAECATSSMDNSKKIKAGKSKSLLSFPLLMPRDSGEKKSRKTNKQIEEIGYKNTSNQSKGDLDLQGWTTDQELALQRAYFSAKPSPHFWKKVSKMVPGRSAQECFDRIHADSITPPQHQPRSRAKKSISSPLGHFSLSGSKLLEPAEPDTKKPKTSRDKKYLAHKTVRHLLKKHNQADQYYQADVFSVLEPGMISSAQSPEAEPVSTPPRLLKKNGFFDECQERSSSHHKKPPLSRFRDSSRMALVSPPVLKPIKNIALHEKYIDQLHCREAKRMAEDRRNLSAKENKSNGNVQKMDVVKAAKNALISDARDMILQFQHLQENPTSDFKDGDDDYDRTSGEDGDDE